MFSRARYLLGTERESLRLGRALRRAGAEAASAEAAVDAAFRTSVGSSHIRPTQIPEEITAFVAMVRAEQPARILEIGTDNGGTLYLLAWASAPGANILSIDVRQYDRRRRRLYRSFGPQRQRVEVCRADSQLDETRRAVERHFEGEPLDLLFIDGDHSYDAVRRDFELYSPLVRSGGMVAFHDIVDGPESAVGGVPRFWREQRPSLGESAEIVSRPDQGGYGIGIGRL